MTGHDGCRGLRVARRLVLLACVLPACSGEDVVFTPEGELATNDEASQPPAHPAASACDCSTLPAMDSRVPWSEAWASIAYRPGGGGIALIGSDWDYSPTELAGSARDAPVAASAPLQEYEDGLHILLWGDDGSVRPVPSPDVLQGHAARRPRDGAWSPDGAHYAARFSIEAREGSYMVTGVVVAVCDVASGEWVSNLSQSWRGADGLAWDPTGREIALLACDARWQDPQLRGLGVPAPDEPVMLLVCDLEGREIRSAPFVPIAGRPGTPCWLGWSPDGHLLATVTKPSTDERGCELHVFDAKSLRQLDFRRMPEWDGPQGCSAPQWNPDSRQLAIPLASGIGRVTLDDAGHLLTKSLLSLENDLLQFAWCPDGTRLLIVEQVHVHDFMEFLGSLSFEDCRNSDTLYRAVPRFIDPVLGKGVDCEDLVQSRRTDRWYRCWSLPRVGEAFALWTR